MLNRDLLKDLPAPVEEQKKPTDDDRLSEIEDALIELAEIIGGE